MCNKLFIFDLDKTLAYREEIEGSEEYTPKDNALHKIYIPKYTKELLQKIQEEEGVLAIATHGKTKHERNQDFTSYPVLVAFLEWAEMQNIEFKAVSEIGKIYKQETGRKILQGTNSCKYMKYGKSNSLDMYEDICRQLEDKKITTPFSYMVVGDSDGDKKFAQQIAVKEKQAVTMFHMTNEIQNNSISGKRRYAGDDQDMSANIIIANNFNAILNHEAFLTMITAPSLGDVNKKQKINYSESNEEKSFVGKLVSNSSSCIII